MAMPGLDEGARSTLFLTHFNFAPNPSSSESSMHWIQMSRANGDISHIIIIHFVNLFIYSTRGRPTEFFSAALFGTLRWVVNLANSASADALIALNRIPASFSPIRGKSYGRTAMHV